MTICLEKLFNEWSEPETIFRHAAIDFFPGKRDPERVMSLLKIVITDKSTKGGSRLILFPGNKENFDQKMKQKMLSPQHAIFLAILMIHDWYHRTEGILFAPKRISYQVISKQIFKDEKIDPPELKNRLEQLKSAINTSVYLGVFRRRRNKNIGEGHSKVKSLILSDGECFWMNTLEPFLPSTEILIDYIHGNSDS
jgi:hypothetical protein